MTRLTLDYGQSNFDDRKQRERDKRACAKLGRHVKSVSSQFRARACIFFNISSLAEIREHIIAVWAYLGVTVGSFPFYRRPLLKIANGSSFFQCIQNEYTITRQKLHSRTVLTAYWLSLLLSRHPPSSQISQNELTNALQ